MNPFSFVGQLPASKSILNRLIIAKSFFPHLNIINGSQCDDVQLMERGLESLFKGQPVECGHAGTVLRFLVFRAARVVGEHELVGSQRLFDRPQEELLSSVRQLGCEVQIEGCRLFIKSQGWRLMGDGLHIRSHRSSQFVSGVLLNSWELTQPLHISLGKDVVSQGYLEMTLSLLRQLGMQVDLHGGEITIKSHQKVSVNEFAAECDMSSAFALAAIAAYDGHFILQNYPASSLQPDAIFVDLLVQMGAEVERTAHQLKVKSSGKLTGVQFNIDRAPDLFPVLAVLCSLAVGESFLYGGNQLAYKESNRLQKIAELLFKMGVNFEVINTSIKVNGLGFVRAEPFEFDCEEDHRLAMAAGLAIKAGYEIKLGNAHVVSKSFPEYWSFAGVTP